MSETQVSALKNFSWKYFGAMFMETKNGQQAISFHKVLGLLMFVWCLVKWSFPDSAGQTVPDHAVYTLWMLLGLKMVTKVAEKFGKGDESGTSE